MQQDEPDRYISINGGQIGTHEIAELLKLRPLIEGSRTASQGEPYPQGGAGYLKKSDGLLRKPKMKRFAFIETWKKAWPIERLCSALKVSSRGYRS